MKPSRIRLLLLLALLACSAPAVHADSIAYTTIPDPSGYHVVTGTNSAGDAASWKAGGHIVYAKSVYPSPPAPPGYYQYFFGDHGSAACQTPACDGVVNATYMRVVAISGAGRDESDPNIELWVSQRVYLSDGTVFSDTPLNQPGQLTIFRDGRDVHLVWAGPPNLVTNLTVQFKVGAWQGAAVPWQVTAATPGL